MSRLVLALICLLLFSTCSQNSQDADRKLFSKLASKETSINFSNILEENDDFNIVEYLYFFNGGGVAIGDINNDGLSDIYFTSNQNKNKLYLNRGNLQFEDITANAGVAGKGNWTTGVTMADINGDGLLDIFVCGVGGYKKFDGQSQLYINNGDLTFSDRTVEFGLSFQGFSTQAAFFDYDLDGDLDMYLLNHSVHSTRSYGQVSLRYQTDSLAGDRLYKNLLVETGSATFIDVTQSAGIYSSQIGYGLGIGISDLNLDGYPDIYVSNDFHENDYLYINQKNGTFSESSSKSLAHTSRFSMGNEIADMNNDLWPDIITTDMMPREERIIKSTAGEDSYEVYRFKLQFGYGKQVSRNTLQLNRGTVDSGRIVFSDIAQVAGIEATDWSWGPLAADFDGDGLKDLFISNGIVRRPNDLEYINFINNDSARQGMISQNTSLSKLMPQGDAGDFIFKNMGNTIFIDKSAEWGIRSFGFSNGAAYGDLDNDGDLDLVINQINGEALIYRNNLNPAKFLKLKLNANSIEGNPFGVGARVIVELSNQTQVQELFPTRGWCSSSDYSLFFGLSEIDDMARVKVLWPNGFQQDTVVTGGLVTINYGRLDKSKALNSMNSIYNQFSVGIIKHIEDDFNAFNRESLIPHMLTTEGPALAVADVNNDGMEDFFLGGAKGQTSAVYVQNTGGDFTKLQIQDFEKHKLAEDIDAVFFDADGDGDKDLVVVSGGHEAREERNLLLPRLYINDGMGFFTYSQNAFANVFLNASCVRACDYDLDGDIDLFIGSSVMPFLYGMSPMSYLLVNDGFGKFHPSHSWLGGSVFDNPTKVRPGMIKDAVWTHLNSDDLPDLILVGEWMPITILIQKADHTFLNETNKFGLGDTNGLWNSISEGDFNNDGLPDFVVGNLGLNSRIKATSEKPLLMYLGDFDSNGGSDHILVYYNGDRSYPFVSRDQLIKQIPSLKRKFPNYQSYLDVKLEDIISQAEKNNSAVLKVQELRSLLLVSDNGALKKSALPIEAQYFPVYSIAVTDANKDGKRDLLLTGNLGAIQPDLGSYDAGIGLLLLGDESGSFVSVPPLKSGFVTLGEGRKIEKLRLNSGKEIFLVARNNNTLLAFETLKD
ncbi:MAG: VCBS repeat-containing protein [Cyclobacteriaceae bacterium]|nr:VCBS repeat-containing protein [Cyclobacteriaceae bacterium]